MCGMFVLEIPIIIIKNSGFCGSYEDKTMRRLTLDNKLYRCIRNTRVSITKHGMRGARKKNTEKVTATGNFNLE